MARMRAVDAAVLVLEKEGISCAFGVPGAAINPLYSALKKAFHLMRSSRPGPVLIDLPVDVQLAEIEFDIDAYEPMVPFKPAMTRAQAEKALTMLNAAEKPLIVAGGGIINADASDLLI